NCIAVINLPTFTYILKIQKMKESICENLVSIHARIKEACITSNRDPKEVQLLLATKTVSADNIKIALEQSESLIAENKVQELKEKFEALKEVPHQTHFIGHLQTNKIKEVLKYVDCIQSVDRLDLAEKLDKRLQFEGRNIDIYLQINTSFEESKFGVPPEEALALAKEISKFDTLRLKGLMTIGLFSAETEKVRRCFKLLKDFQHKINELALPNVDMKTLSMGMSGDLEVAIEEGSTMVRIGTAIFGKRKYPDSYYWNENLK
ncbi:MAG: YggS family pyridoxal phosphate-dependent enzyme, partial [Ginsengibacter sp.]